MGTSNDCDVSLVEAHVRRRVWGQVVDLRVEAHDRGVLLRGRAHSYYLKQLAQHAVLELCQVRLAANEIEVTWPG
jgi:hypothetical protein